MDAKWSQFAHKMSTTPEVIRRHRNLTHDIRTRVTDGMFGDLEKIAKKRGLPLSTSNREAFAEYIEAHKGKGK